MFRRKAELRNGRMKNVSLAKMIGLAVGAAAGLIVVSAFRGVNKATHSVAEISEIIGESEELLMCLDTVIDDKTDENINKFIVFFFEKAEAKGIRFNDKEFTEMLLIELIKKFDNANDVRNYFAEEAIKNGK